MELRSTVFMVAVIVLFIVESDADLVKILVKKGLKKGLPYALFPLSFLPLALQHHSPRSEYKPPPPMIHHPPKIKIITVPQPVPVPVPVHHHHRSVVKHHHHEGKTKIVHVRRAKKKQKIIFETHHFKPSTHYHQSHEKLRLPTTKEYHHERGDFGGESFYGGGEIPSIGEYGSQQDRMVLRLEGGGYDLTKSNDESPNFDGHTLGLDANSQAFAKDDYALSNIGELLNYQPNQEFSYPDHFADSKSTQHSSFPQNNVEILKFHKDDLTHHNHEQHHEGAEQEVVLQNQHHQDSSTTGQNHAELSTQYSQHENSGGQGHESIVSPQASNDAQLVKSSDHSKGRDLKPDASHSDKFYPIKKKKHLKKGASKRYSVVQPAQKVGI